MKKINVLMTAFLILLSQSIYAVSPLGYWKTIDDVSGETKSIVQIEALNQGLIGKVVKLFQDPTKICTACTGSRKNQPILGMIIMENLKPSTDNANLWSNGEIVDPKTGKVYHCNIQTLNQGQKLQVRGFVGIPLFGRSQTWIRVEKL